MYIYVAFSFWPNIDKASVVFFLKENLLFFLKDVVFSFFFEWILKDVVDKLTSHKWSWSVQGRDRGPDDAGLVVLWAEINRARAQIGPVLLYLHFSFSQSREKGLSSGSLRRSNSKFHFPILAVAGLSLAHQPSQSLAGGTLALPCPSGRATSKHHQCTASSSSSISPTHRSRSYSLPSYGGGQ